MESLNGAEFNGRNIVVEVAKDEKGGRGGSRRGDSSRRSFRDNRDSSFRDDRRSRPRRDFGDDNRRPRRDRDSSGVRTERRRR